MHTIVTGKVASVDGVRAAGNTQVLNFSIADNTYAKGEGGNKNDGSPWNQRTTWVRVAYFGERAAKIAPHIQKGSYVVVRGEGSIREYEHNGVKKTSFELKADNIELGPRVQANGANAAPNGSHGNDEPEVEIPF